MAQIESTSPDLGDPSRGPVAADPRGDESSDA
jgi:hypothetical protein